jgi:PAS domain S-box-containing protein
MEHPVSLSAPAPVEADPADPVVPTLERVARLAAAAFAVPFATVVRFGAGGDGVAEAPVSHGRLRPDEAAPDLRLACAGLPADAALVVVEDATRDARFRLPAAARFFACARAEGADGRALGAVCLLDDAPRTLGAVETERLADLAAVAAFVLDAGALHAARAQAEIRFQALSDAVFDALLITEAGVVLDANGRAADLFGCADPEALVGRSLFDLVPARLAGTVRAWLAVPGRYEAAVLRPDGTEVPVAVSATTFPHEGRILRVSAVRAGD